MANVTVTSSAVLQSSAAKMQKPFLAAQDTTPGRPVFLNSSNEWELAHCADATHGAAVTAMVGISANEAADGQPLTVVTEDINFYCGATLVKGALYVVSTDAGRICPLSDLVSTSYRMYLGAAISTTALNLKPTQTGATTV